jgi:peroxiredoxin 2/4
METLVTETLPLEPAALPRLGQPAPEFEAVTTHGVLRLSDFRDRWLVLFSHPADFTPVCTTEFIAFSELYDEFQARGVDLLGLSIDSVYSHIAWVRNVKEKMGVEIPFPIIADLDRKVATAYGMVMPGESKTEAARCVFVIDPNGILKAMIYYPMSLGRNMREILRMIDGLQLNAKHGVATPANWQPGGEVMLGAPMTMELVEERIAEGRSGMKDWYFTKTPAPDKA